ncbi:hypothetical protein TNCV_3394541 [Trichonephila clavipes]|nr:hypothetical protein TNCV_3394541 [Trichonephila clavipes]
MRFFKITVPDVVGYLKASPMRYPISLRKGSLRRREVIRAVGDGFEDWGIWSIKGYYPLIMIVQYLYDDRFRPSGIVISDADCCVVRPGFESGEDMDVYKCIVSLRHGVTLNSC